MNEPRDLAGIRYDNALLLFEEFVQQAARNPDPATLRGLEGRFAERLQVQPSYWSQIKGRSRQIGERLARQFEERCGKPWGWMDSPQRHRLAETPAPAPAASADETLPVSDDERFIVGLVLTYYRRHPDRARARLLDLLSEVLAPVAETPAAAASAAARTSALQRDADLWRKSQAGVQPLKRKR
jgi:hypothetical protein